MNDTSEIDTESLNLETTGDIIGVARSLVNGRHPGILATVDDHGKPAVRWMSTLSFEEFPVFYTLTASDSRKVAQIQRHPDVNWMFFNQSKNLVLNLIGKAQILTDVVTLKDIWQKVENKSHLYFINRYAKGLGFVVIETRVEAIECTSPKSALRFAIEPGELKDERY